MFKTLRNCCLCNRRHSPSSYHAGDASCQAAVVAGLAVGGLCCPQLPPGKQQHGPDRTWVWDAGNEVTGPSSLPGCREHTQGKHSELQKRRCPPVSTEKHSQKTLRHWVPMLACPDFRLRIFKFRIILQHNHKRETTQRYHDYTWLYLYSNFTSDDPLRSSNLTLIEFVRRTRPLVKCSLLSNITQQTI